ncbi:MAG: sugar transferase [Gracilimonas sp.]|nr:sugar transferase [Gracilimonas sp.]
MLKLRRYREVIFTGILDFIIVLAGWFIFHSYSEVIWEYQLFDIEPYIVSNGFFYSFFWLALFVVTGVYKKLYLVSRLDEFIRIAKASFIGVLVLFFISGNEQQNTWEVQRQAVFLYGLTVFVFMAVNRFIIRTIQKYFAQKGKGLHRAIIVGAGRSAKVAYEDLNRNKILGMEVLGFVSLNGHDPDPSIGIEKDKILGNIDDIEQIINDWQVQDIMVALDPEHREKLVNIIAKTDSPEISLKLLPDFHQVVSGLSKTNQIFGMPLIEVSPEPMQLWEQVAKRSIDVIMSITVLTLTFPFLLIIVLLIRLTSDGQAIYKQTRVGRNGKPFTMYKFRTMQDNAEKNSGPQWASKDDPRVTPIGKLLRRLRIDEIPQFINVLKGDMSLVGPRPERPHFVEQFSIEVPLYSRRLRVRPGITGWAQVKWKYDASMDDVREKTKYDLFYIENASLKMDAKILINTIMTVIKGRGQ